MQDQSVEHFVDEDTVFGNLQQNHSALWSLLFMSGYLKIIHKENRSRGLWCQLKIPNREVGNLYRKIIEEWLAGDQGIEGYDRFLTSLLTGDMPNFERILKSTLEKVISIHDLARNPETFYHGFMLGLSVSLHDDKRYELASNRESGYGRCDFLLLSHDPTRLSIVLEFKRVEPEKSVLKLTKKLEAAAKAGLTQIEVQQYAALAEQKGQGKVLKVAIAFCGKHFALRHVGEIK